MNVVLMVNLCLLERLEKSYLLVEGRLCIQQSHMELFRRAPKDKEFLLVWQNEKKILKLL